jgi:oligopeptide transport system ATP-binding protein
MIPLNQHPLIELKGISKNYYSRRKILHALCDVNLNLYPGKTVAIAGESGSGKSTLGKLVAQLEEPSSGSLYFEGKDLRTMNEREKRILRRRVQVIFQDPFSSLNPRMTVKQIVGEGIDIHKICKKNEKQEKIEKLLFQVGLEPSIIYRYPHELSGGQRQRIGIARAFAVDPELLILDEPLSALDVCTQSHVLDLLMQLKAERQLSYLFISHDLNAVRIIADYVAILYLGKIVEYAPKSQLFTRPSHPYTETLLAAIPTLDLNQRKSPKPIPVVRTAAVDGNEHPFMGCPFQPRCPKAMAICKIEVPLLHQIASDHYSRCHNEVIAKL